MLVQVQSKKEEDKIKAEEELTAPKNDDTEANEDAACSKDISIDPKTYCKLGHFHLLLEDYAKGSPLHLKKIKMLYFYTVLYKLLKFQPCQLTKNFSNLNLIIGKIQLSCMD